ncbi:hypothetical protein JCM3775_003474 [Rhodotorula graminis]
MDAVEQRLRSSSLTEGAPRRSNSRVFLGLDALRSNVALPNPRRRSSGGQSVQGGAGSIPGLVRRDSTRAPTRAIPSPVPSPIPPQFRTLDSYNARNVAAALDQSASSVDDAWQQVCVRVLPLFNGEGIRGFVEDLNALVTSHVQRRFAQSQSARQRSANNPSVNVASLVTGLIIADLTDLIRVGLTTLAHKLAPPPPAQPLDNGRLLARLNEVWLFFFTGILPHLEAVFWVLRSDDRLRAAVGHEARSAREREEGRIDVRRIALIEFRDEILHPGMGRLVPLISAVYQGGVNLDSDESRPASRRASVSSSYPAASPPDIRRARSHPHPPSRPISPALGASPAPPPRHPQRQYSSPPRLSPDPNYVSSFLPSSSGSARRSLAGAPVAPAATTAQAFARRRQMVAVLAALRTDDDRQGEMDALLRLIRPAPAPSGARYRPRRGSSASPSPSGHEQPRSGYSTPGEPAFAPRGGAPFQGEEDGDLPGSGAVTGLTGSPIDVVDEPSSISSHGEGGDILPAPVRGSAFASPLPRAIDARQRHRSRTMDSLDEEDAHAHLTQPSLVPPVPQLPPSRASSDGVGGPGQALSAAELAQLQRAASPVAVGAAATSSASAAASAGVKKARRRSFLPGFKRSNSTASTSTNASGGTAITDGHSDDESLAVPGGAAGGAAGGIGGDKLRRGLLRRNSSRRAVELVGAGAAGPALGAAGGFAVEDDE